MASASVFTGRVYNGKVRLFWAFTVLTLIALAVLAAGRAQAESLGFSLEATPAPGAEAGDLTVSVVDDETGAPLSDAAVTISDSLEDDHGLRGVTGAEGKLIAQGALAKGPRTLTVTKDGYSTTSLAGLQSAQVTIFLKPLPSARFEADPTVIASGEMAKWPGKGGSSTVTAGIVFKSLSALDLLGFSTDSFISPLKDTINVMGPREIPSNFAIPPQDISVVFMPVHLEKPRYRLPVTRGKPVRLAGVQGNVPVSDLVAIAQGGGKMSMGLLNKLNFTHAGITAPLKTDNDFSATIDAGMKLKPAHHVSPSVPPFAADILVAAATDLDGSRSVLLPTDLKTAAEAAAPGKVKTVKLNAPEAGKGIRNVLTVAMADKGHRVSGIVSANAAGKVAPGSFLNVDKLADVPTVPDTITLKPMATGVSAVLYESAGDAIAWYVYMLPGKGPSQVPSRSLPPSQQVTGYSVMQLDFGSGFNPQRVDGQKIMTQLVRFTRATANVGKTSDNF